MTVGSQASIVEDGRCQEIISPLTRRGRLIQLWSLIGLPLLPCLSLVIYSFCNIASAVNSYQRAVDLNDLLSPSSVALDLIAHLEEEMGGAVMTIGADGSQLLGVMDEFYVRTGRIIDDAPDWPYFPSAYDTKLEFSDYLEGGRERLSTGNTSVLQQLHSYRTAMSVFADWIVQPLLQKNSSATTSNTIISYVALMKALLELSVQRALGCVYYMNPPFLTDEHVAFQEAVARGRDSLRTAILYDKLIERLYAEQFTSNVFVVAAIEEKQRDIELNDLDHQDIYDSVLWYRNIGNYIVIIRTLCKRIVVQMNDLAHDGKTQATVDIIYNIAIIVFVCAVLVPCVVYMAVTTGNNIYIHARTMQRHGTHLKREKRKTENILNEMLPRVVAYRMRKGEVIEAEQFQSVTVFFSDIADFGEISEKSSPIQVVGFLNDLYTFMDESVERYDVYKVETIGCVYMVVSGLPSRNGKRHASEIGRMSLDLLTETENFRIPHMPNKRLQLRIGAHTGPVVAGVVGNKTPRYCLFGDTVNTSSRMQTNGLARRIHITRSMNDLLTTIGGFVTEERGEVHVKGKGSMYTYWLIAREDGKQRSSVWGKTRSRLSSAGGSSQLSVP